MTTDIDDLLAGSNMGHVTIADRMLLHLLNHNLRPGSICVPFDLTQDGIATIVGVTRAHASTELKKLLKGGFVIAWKSHLPGGGPKRLSYALSPTGTKRASDLAEALERNGVPPELLLNYRRCNPVTLWADLSESDRDAMGRACVLRVPVPRRDLPGTEKDCIPIDSSGNVSIPRTVSRNFISFAGPERQRSWHRWAAEYWLNRRDCTERLYHLICAKMDLEAGMCVSLNRGVFESSPSFELLSMMLKIEGRGPYNTDVCTLGASVALNLGRMDVVDRFLDPLRIGDPDIWGVLKSALLLARGESEKAAALAENAFELTGDPYAAAIASEAHSDLGDAETAGSLADLAFRAVGETGDGEHIDEVFLAMARSSLLNGCRMKARTWAEKALRSAPQYRRARPTALLASLDGATPGGGAVQ